MDMESKPKTVAILNSFDFERGLSFLQRNENFIKFRNIFLKLRDDVVSRNKVTTEQATSIINYALHNTFDEYKD